MTELSHFESESAKTPVKEPYAILIGTVLLAIILYILNHLAPNEGVASLKEAKAKAEAPAAVTSPSAAEEADNI
jgi:hypothetical protein